MIRIPGGMLFIVGGILAVGVSLVLLVSVMARASVGLNWLNGITIFGAAIAGWIAFTRPRSIWKAVLADALLLIAIVPAMGAYIWLLYVPSFVLLLTGTARLSVARR